MKLASIAAFTLISVGCAATTPKDPTTARAAVYNAELDVLLGEMATEVKKHYPNIAVRPDEQAVKTAWHALPIKEARSDSGDPVWGAQNVGKDDNARYREHRRNNTTEPTRYFIRFDARLAPAGAPGGNQWKVVVSGQASVFDPRGVPTELKGAERPYWLDARLSKLEIAIYERLRGRVVATAE